MSIKKVVIDQFNNPLQSLQETVSAYTNYLKIAEEEKTKRRDIEAWEKTIIAQINAQRDLLIGYLERSFDERAINFRALFTVVDSAISSGNNEQLALTLNSITELAKSSPFKELANLNQVRAALDDPNHEWEF
jgi:septal ring factor EnvC (AmiA/AmiB activator)